MTQAEQAAGLPHVPSFDEPAAIAPRPRRQRAETDPQVVMASLSRASQLRNAVGWTLASVALLSALPYGLAERDLVFIYVGALLLLCGLLAAYVGSCLWWYIVRGEMFRSPPWLSGVGRTVVRILNVKIGH